MKNEEKEEKEEIESMRRKTQEREGFALILLVLSVAKQACRQ